ncbi:unnamed protein product, partial [Cyprideis torosa]
ICFHSISQDMSAAADRDEKQCVRVREPAQLSWLQQLVSKCLTSGEMPKHVGFIMDGNRRFAAKLKQPKIEGHVQGSERLFRVLDWCHQLGIPEVTVYAFSIENYKRSEQEVAGLMKLAREKLEELLKSRSELEELECQFRVIGNLSLVPADLRESMALLEEKTKNYSKGRLNIAFAYTGRDELLRATRRIASGVSDGVLSSSDISYELVTQCLDTADSPPVDLLIRTSGEVRLSDFLLWQSSFACLLFVKCLWPDFTFWDLLGAIFHYQVNYPELQAKRQFLVRLTERDTNIPDESKARRRAFLSSDHYLDSVPLNV